MSRLDGVWLWGSDSRSDASICAVSRRSHHSYAMRGKGDTPRPSLRCEPLRTGGVSSHGSPVGNCGEPLPGIPMYHGLKRVPGTGVKGSAVGIGNRDQSDLCHLCVGNPQELCRFFFTVEMKDGPTRAETTRTGGKHEVPRRWHNGAGHGMLQSQWESLKTR